MQLDENIRWKFRYDGDFRQKVLKLIDLVSEMQEKELSGNFDYNQGRQIFNLFLSTFNGAVRTLKDYMRYQGIFQVDTREIIKEAFYVEIIEDGQSWIDMMFDANDVNPQTLEGFDFYTLSTRYLKAFTDLVKYFQERTEK